MIGPPQEGEAGSEQVRFVCWGPLIGVAALYLPPDQGETFGEPSSHMEPIQHMKSVGKVLRDGCLIRAGPVGNDYLHLPAPGPLIPEEPGQGPFRTTRDHRQHLAGVPGGDHGHIPMPDGGLLTLFGSLVVEAEEPDGYDRGLFRHWVDADGDGCDTRREVLITEAVTAPTVGGGCGLSDGVWVSRYDGETETGNGRGFDIDHLVPLKEAWDSGAHGWDAQTRERFANDLGYEHSLVAVSAGSNRSKGAQDPTTWLPPERSQRCWYAAAWINVKARWDLSVDPAEADTLRNIISGCRDNAADTALPAPVVTGAQSATTPAAGAGSQDEGCHPDYSPCIPHLEGDALNCGDLTTAQKPVTVRVVGVDPYQLDRDGDGRGCTS